MIQIKQNNYDLNGLSNLIQKHNTSNFSINTMLIDEDIKKLKYMTKNAKNKSDLSNMNIIIRYLEKFKSKVSEDGIFQISWNYEKWRIKSYPLDINHFKEYNIKATDYIEVGKEKLVKFDYGNVFPNFFPPWNGVIGRNIC